MHGEFSVAQKVQAVVRGAATVNEAEDSALALYPVLKALAFIVAVLVRVMVPVYRVED